MEPKEERLVWFGVVGTMLDENGKEIIQWDISNNPLILKHDFEESDCSDCDLFKIG